MTDEEIKAKWLKKDKKIGRYIVLSIFGVLLILACVFWEHTIVFIYSILLRISYFNNRFHTCEGIYKCSETFELSDGMVIEEFYFDFERITYTEYKKHAEQRDQQEFNFALQGDDKNGYYLVKAYLKFSGDEEAKEYPVRVWHNNPKTREIEIIIQDLDETISIVWSYQYYNFVDSKKYKRVLSSIDLHYLLIKSISTDDKGNHTYDEIVKEFKLEYQGNIE